MTYRRRRALAPLLLHPGARLGMVFSQDSVPPSIHGPLPLNLVRSTAPTAQPTTIMREWVTETAFSLYAFMQPIFGIAFLIVLFVLIPLGLVRKTRRFAATVLFIASYIFGATVWLFSVGIAFALLGWFWLIVGLLLAGIGVVPVAFFGALFNGESGIAFMGILLPVVLTYGTRLLSQHWVTKSEAERPSAHYVGPV